MRASSIPEDYGGVHEVIALIDGKPVAQNGINVTQTFALTPTSGPVGTPIELKVTGLGWRTMESTWVVNWDNHELGFVSAAGTRGSAVARFRATGPSGDHIVKLYTGWQGQGYLNYEQSPVAALPRPEFTFRTTSGAVARHARTPNRISPSRFRRRNCRRPACSSDAHADAGTGRHARGAEGRRLRPRRAAAAGLGNLRRQPRVGRGSRHRKTRLARSRPMPNGRIDSTLTIPDDLGGLHGLALRSGDEPGRARLLRHRNQHRRHVAAIRARGHARHDSLEGRRLDRVRQHLRRHLRQRVHGLRLRLQQQRRRRDQLHRDRRTGRPRDRSLSRASTRVPRPSRNSCIDCRS